MQQLNPASKTPSRHYLKIAALAAWAILIVLLALPLPANIPGVGLDNSWDFALTEISRKGLAFGSNIEFIYGPYYFLLTKLIHPALLSFEICISLVWATSYMACVLILVKHHAHRHRAFIFTLFISLLLTVDFGSRDAFFYCSLFIAYDCLLLHPRQAHITSVMYRWPALFIFAFAPFNKISFGVTSLGLLFLAALYSVYRKDYRQGCLILAEWAIITTVLWLAAAQNLTDLPAYYLNLFITSVNHGDAMKMAGDSLDVMVGVFAATTGLLALWHDGKRAPNNNVRMAGLAFVLFVSFKTAFVRHDLHIVVMAGTLLFLTCYLLMKEWNRFNLSAASCCALSAAYLLHATHMPFEKAVNATVHNLISHIEAASDVLGGGHTIKANFAAALENIRHNNPLPSLAGTVDSVSYHQAELIANGLDYHPRPTLQSVTIFCPWLVNQNERWVKEHPSDYVLFNLEPIDERYPTLEEGRLMLYWLSRYTLQGHTPQGFLILHARQKKDASAHTPVITPLVDITAHVNQEVLVPVMGKMILAEIMVEPSIYGEFMGLLYKREPLDITVHTSLGTTYRHVFIAGMAQAGFILSPYMNNTSAVERQFTHPENLPSDIPAVTSFVINDAMADSPWHTWNAAYRVRLFTVTFPSDAP